MLADRDQLAVVDDENLDAENLFAYLLLEKYVPRNVFFTAELTFESNMVVLNSCILQRYENETNKSGLMNDADQDALSKKKTLNDLLMITLDKFKSKKQLFASKSIVGRNESSANPLAVSMDGNNSSTRPVKRNSISDSIRKSISVIVEKAPTTVTDLYNASTSFFAKLPRKNNNDGGKVDSFTVHSNVLDSSSSASIFSILKSHHTLPVFASGRAFTPSTIDCILANVRNNIF